VLTWLQEGNARWVSGKPTSPNTATSRREDVATNGQHPFVTVLTCADSRMPVERVFDRGVGDVFVVRVAGNVAGNSETGTVEYGVGHLKTPLLVVMGHTKCGAVAAAASGAQLPGKLGELVGHIAPAVDRARKNNPGVDDAGLAVIAINENVWQTIYDLYKGSPEILGMVEAGELKVVGAVCDITTGKVEWLGEHPWQSELITALKNTAGTTGTADAESGH
jgi:carbonic anhydrase